MKVIQMKKISMAQAKMMMEEGLIRDQAHLEQLQRKGKVAGLREKESYRLKGVSEKITACMPSSKVTIAGKKTYKELNQNDQNVVDVFKKALNDAVRPIYEEIRAQFTEKVIVTQ
jgi:hypothetical protein